MKKKTPAIAPNFVLSANKKPDWKALSDLLDWFFYQGAKANFPEESLQHCILFLSKLEQAYLVQQSLMHNPQHQSTLSALPWQQVRHDQGIVASYSDFLRQFSQESWQFEVLPGFNQWQSYIIFCASNPCGMQGSAKAARACFLQTLWNFQLEKNLSFFWNQIFPDFPVPRLLLFPGEALTNAEVTFAADPENQASTVDNPTKKIHRSLLDGPSCQNSNEAAWLASSPLSSIAQALRTNSLPSKEVLVNFWQQHSGGIISQFSFFNVESHSVDEGDKNAALLAADRLQWRFIPKRLQYKKHFTDLFGWEQNTQILTQNVTRFLNNTGGMHMYLWGDRGMGKTSSVLALASHFEHELKIIELQKKDINLLPSLLTKLQGYKEKFLCFIDDLSFAQQDDRIRSLKICLEKQDHGPEQWLFVITSNHRNLVLLDPNLDVQNPKQRQIHDEARALDDRLGLKLFYPAWQYGQLKHYLCAIASANKVVIDDEEKFYRDFLNYCQINHQDLPSARAIQLFLANQSKASQ